MFSSNFTMEILAKLVIGLCFLCLLSVACASGNCEFSAIFNFGDSNSDTGGLAAAFMPPNSPYGQTYFHMPAGRYSDGRLIIDFIAKSLNLPFLSAYLDSLGTSFKHGANFATSASTIRLPTSIIPNGGYSPFYLDVQHQQFNQFISRSNIIRGKELYVKDYLGKALYTFDIGQNDLGAGFASKLSLEEVNASVPDIINSFSVNVRNTYNLGARSFWIHNTGPIGCLPYIFVNFPLAEKDNAGCAKAYNEIAKYFNAKLKESIAQLRKDLPLASLTYVDIYSVKYSLYKEPEKYGFELPLVACCGYGGAYNFSDIARCGDRNRVNDTEIVVDSSCDRPWVRVNWDGVHYTEAANKFIFDQISSGAFSDPPIPLKMACQKV